MVRELLQAHADEWARQPEVWAFLRDQLALPVRAWGCPGVACFGGGSCGPSTDCLASACLHISTKKPLFPVSNHLLLQAAWLAEAQALRAHYCADDAGKLCAQFYSRPPDFMLLTLLALLCSVAALGVCYAHQLPCAQQSLCRPPGPAAGCRRLAGGAHAAV